MWHWVTLTKGQGHSVYFKVKNYQFLALLNNLSDTIYWKYGYKIWPKDSLWGVLQNDVTLDDLEGQGDSRYLKVRQYPFGIFLDNILDAYYL